MRRPTPAKSPRRSSPLGVHAIHRPPAGDPPDSSASSPYSATTAACIGNISSIKIAASTAATCHPSLFLRTMAARGWAAAFTWPDNGSLGAPERPSPRACPACRGSPARPGRSSARRRSSGGGVGGGAGGGGPSRVQARPGHRQPPVLDWRPPRLLRETASGSNRQRGGDPRRAVNKYEKGWVGGGKCNLANCAASQLNNKLVSTSRIAAQVSNRGTGGPPLLLLTALAAASIASHSPHRRAAAGPGGDVTSKTTGRERVTDARGHARAEGRRARQRATGAKFRNRAWPKVHGSGDCCALLDDIGTIPPKKKNRIKGERSPDERDVRMAVRLRVATLARDTARPLVASPRRVPSSRPFVVAHKPRRRRLRSQETSKIRAPRRARDPRRTSDTAAANVNI
ncbi:unnamed protein product [Lampetra fluviatilis]